MFTVEFNGLVNKRMSVSCYYCVWHTASISVELASSNEVTTLFGTTLKMIRNSNLKTVAIPLYLSMQTPCVDIRRMPLNKTNSANFFNITYRFISQLIMLSIRLHVGEEKTCKPVGLTRNIL